MIQYKLWYENGQLEVQYVYKDGKLKGEYKSWYENGQLEEQCEYKDDKRNGECNIQKR